MKQALFLSALALSACQVGEPRSDEAAAVHSTRSPAVPDPFTADEVARILDLSPLPPPPSDPTNAFADRDDAARLGQYVFFDERFSKDGKTSCATCHDPKQGWGDGRPLGVGVTELERQTMTLWNVGYNRWFFWDGRADSLWAQALIPFENPFEHAGSRLQFAHIVNGDSELRGAYEAVFGALPELDDANRFPPAGRPVPNDDDDRHLKLHKRVRMPETGHGSHSASAPFTHPHQRAWDTMDADDQEAINRFFANLGKAIAAFERRIVSRRAPFDVFVEGLREHDEAKLATLSPAARRGLKLFVGKARCTLCHHGPAFTDKEFHDIRVPPLREDLAIDPGRGRGIELVKRNEFRGVGAYSDETGGEASLKLDYLPTHVHGAGELKTPTLRNVALTAPYMHQGQLATLEDVVRYYSTLEGAVESENAERILIPLDLSDGEQADLVAFLHSLTDDSLDPALTRRPASPLARLDSR